MKIKIALLSICSLLLIACSSEVTEGEKENNSAEAESQEQEIEKEKENITFTSGEINGSVIGDRENYIDVQGTANGFNSVFVLYEGTVIEELPVNSRGNWRYYSKGETNSAQLTFSTDNSLSVGDNNVRIKDLDNSASVTYLPNSNTTKKGDGQEVEEETASSEIGKRSNPVSYGDTMYMIGTFTDRDANYEEFDANVEITIIETFRGEEAWELISSENQFNDPAPEGKEYIINRVKIVMNNATNENLKTEFNSHEFDYISDQGASYSVDSQVIPDKLDVELYNNGEAEGNIFGLVNIDDLPLLRFNSTFFFETE